MLEMSQRIYIMFHVRRLQVRDLNFYSWRNYISHKLTLSTSEIELHMFYCIVVHTVTHEPQQSYMLTQMFYCVRLRVKGIQRNMILTWIKYRITAVCQRWNKFLYSMSGTFKMKSCYTNDRVNQNFNRFICCKVKSPFTAFLWLWYTHVIFHLVFVSRNIINKISQMFPFL